MEISSAISTFTAMQNQALRPVQPVKPIQPGPQQNMAAYDGPDQEDDGDRDDRGNVTATRGQNLNIVV